MNRKKIDLSHIVAYTISLVLVVLIVIKLFNYFENKPTNTIKQPLKQNELDIAYGSDSAKLTVFMYSSYSCSYCKLFFDTVFPEFKKNYIDNGKVKLVIRLLETSNNPDAMNAAKTAVCINKYGKFDKLNQLLLTDHRVIYTNEFRQMVNEFEDKDVNVAECILGGKADDYILQIRSEFHNFGLTGTPTFIIGKKVYKGYRDYPNFKKLIDYSIKN
ncbi:MAG: thioredoxin domain-containing protein [Bacteroidales bacterium]|nr:thioredoxin domain-containing protein [Bacteroidales bacterium]HPD95068.1 thioredoxin domain-containing protein [Tenuifilaceae bacterium]HRX30383.1 thioredoxin domain-containing protein [Tenuifilaceae bacterium]